MRECYLTFDYELFFGERAGDAMRSVIAPTDHLLDLLAGMAARATFFIDVLWYSRLVENDATRGQAALVERQLARMAADGHALGLHLHPHWLDAVWRGDTWHFPHYRRYRLQDLDPGTRRTVVERGCRALAAALAAAGIGGRVDVFRAGGWCIEPFAPLAELLAGAGIRVDSSVVPGLFVDGSVHRIDFRAAPRAPVYRFARSVLAPERDGRFIEAPVSMLPKPVTAKLAAGLRKALRPEWYAAPGEGTGIPLGRGRWRAWRDYLCRPQTLFSLDREDPGFLRHALRGRKDLVLVAVSHPKAMSPSSFACLAALPGILPDAEFVAMTPARLAAHAGEGAV